MTIAGHEPPAGRSTIPVSYNIVGKDYFRTMGIPVRQGREFAATDRGGPPAVIVNETLATRYWPAEDPLGRQIGGFGPDGQIAAQIVGVVADIKYKSLGEEPRPFVYAFVEQDYFPMTTYHLRTDDDPMALLTGVRHELRKLDPAVALESVSTLDELRAIPMLPSRAVAMLAGWFGLIALALTSIGLYGLVSASVGQRTREIGIRIALGARPGEMFRRVVLYGTSLAGVGVVLGWLASLGVTRFLEGLLFRVTATDPATFASVAVLLVTVALLASYLPARRAARVDPVVSLRQE